LDFLGSVWLPQVEINQKLQGGTGSENCSSLARLEGPRTETPPISKQETSSSLLRFLEETTSSPFA
jgi:hypothetical protein